MLQVRWLEELVPPLAGLLNTYTSSLQPPPNISQVSFFYQLDINNSRKVIKFPVSARITLMIKKPIIHTVVLYRAPIGWRPRGPAS